MDGSGRSEAESSLKNTVKRWLKAPARAVSGLWRAATRPTASQLNIRYDKQAEAILRKVVARDSVCIDVGCHEGAILDSLLRLAPSGTHYAFEPLPHLYSKLVAKYSGVASVRLSEVALSDKAGVSTFQHVVSNPGYSGILRRRYDRAREEIVEISVTLAKLDDIVPSDAPVRLVKIDVEGGELQVLRGGVETLRRCRPFVVFEHGLGAADYYETRPEQVFDLLASCGLRVSLMIDWLEAGDARALTREAFADEFDSGRNYYYLAHP
jgi:FkbM family methyltransferase